MFSCIFYVCGNTVNQIIIGSLVILFIAFRVFLHYYHRKRNYRKTVTRLRIDPNDRFFVQYAGQTQWELLDIQKYKRIVGYVYPLANGKYRGRFLDLQQNSAILKHLYIPLTTSITAKSLIRSENSQARVNDVLIDQIFRLKCLKEGYRIVVTRTFWMAIPQKSNSPPTATP
jgi:hypothetical protein